MTGSEGKAGSARSVAPPPAAPCGASSLPGPSRRSGAARAAGRCDTSLAGIAEALAGPARCRVLLDGSPEQGLEFARWFVPLWEAALDDPFGHEGMLFRGWARIVDDARVAEWMNGLGVPSAVLRRGPVAALRTHGWHGDGRGGLLCEPAGWAEMDATASLAVPVFSAGPEAGFEILDAVAIDARAPERWARLTGAEPVLGSGFGFRAWLPWPERIRLHRTPFGFLAGGAAPGSCCVLDWGAAEARDLLFLIGEGDVAPVCDDDAHAAEIRALARPKRARLSIEVAAGGPDGAGGAA